MIQIIQTSVLRRQLKRFRKEHKKNLQQCLSLFLTRYVGQKPCNLSHLSSAYSNVTLEWKTIHASKGLEADYVIIHHMNNGNFEFPSEISDDPLLDLVIPEKETFPYAEERRLLYVALTRAKRLYLGSITLMNRPCLSGNFRISMGLTF